MSVGDIDWVDLPSANGHEQRGRRPAVVLQDDDYGGDLPVVLVVPLTTIRIKLSVDSLHEYDGFALVLQTLT